MEALVILVTEDGVKVVAPAAAPAPDTAALDLLFQTLQGGG